MGRLGRLEGRVPKIAAVLVHYHAAELAGRACDALLHGARADGLELDLVVVDNGSTAAERALLDRLPGRLLGAGASKGYAGGVNLGLRETETEIAVVLNPDVFVRPGCLGALVRAVQSGAAVAGPRFFWDLDRKLLLPPTERVGRFEELLRVLAGRSPRWARLARRRWRRHARRHWQAREPFRSCDLSGALLAVSRDAWRSVGSFDEGYRLYFEETDWLCRLRAAGLSALYVPGAEAIHLYAQSTSKEPRAEGWFLESSRRFRRRWYGPRYNSLLERLAARRPPSPPVAARRLDGSATWLEISPSPLGFPAAGHLLESEVEPRLLDEIRQAVPAGQLFARTVDPAGRELSFASC